MSTKQMIKAKPDYQGAAVYALLCDDGDGVYIGSTNDFQRRMHTWETALRHAANGVNGRHISQKFASKVNGGRTFFATILEELPSDMDLRERMLREKNAMKRYMYNDNLLNKNGIVFDETGVTEAKKKANQKWDAANLKRLSLAMPIDDYNAMRDRIGKTGESQNAFINGAIRAAVADAEPGKKTRDDDDCMVIRIRRDGALYRRIQAAADKLGVKKAQYIRYVIDAGLSADGE